MNFENKVVIVTGASSGIGTASAILFASYGASLAIVGRDEERLEHAARQCEEASGLPPLCIQVDLTDQGACEAVISKTIARYGRIDVLVNCAGKILIGSLFDDTLDVFDKLININLRVPYKLTHLALPHLIRTKGNIVNLNATRNCRVRHGFLPFAISKAALEKFSKSAAVELADSGVRVNSIQPGVTRTNMMRGLGIAKEDADDIYKCLASKINVLDADEVANVVVFMASDCCPSMNGVHIKLDGAQSLDYY